MSKLSTFALLGCMVCAPAVRAATLPAQTAVPVLFTRTINAAKAKAGDKVTARTMQIVVLPNGEQLPRGTRVEGHVVEAHPFQFNDTPYAAQQPSDLAIQIDTIQDTRQDMIVRAMANANDVREAMTPQGIDESNSAGTMVLVGGAHYSPIAPRVTAGPEDDIVAYNKKQGIFAHLQSGNGCPATSTEQSIAVFSPDACGLYGFASVHMTENDGTFRLASTHHTVTLYAGTAALLQVK